MRALFSFSCPANCTLTRVQQKRETKPTNRRAYFSPLQVLTPFLFFLEPISVRSELFCVFDLRGYPNKMTK